MQARTMAVGGTAQADLPGQPIERAVNISAVQAIAPTGHKHIRGHRPLTPMARASAEVRGEHPAGRRMQRDEASLAELRAADGQHPGLQIDILKLKVAGLAQPQTRNTQEPEQTPRDPGTQGATV